VTFYVTFDGTALDLWSGDSTEPLHRASDFWIYGVDAARVLNWQSTINALMVWLDRNFSPEALHWAPVALVLTREQALDLAKSREYRDFAQMAPDALDPLQAWNNPNADVGLSPYYYGLRVAVLPPPAAERAVA
jgi:hypothetical protein